MSNQFRADLITMDDKERVPCGMNTIIWLADVSIRLSAIRGELEKQQNKDKVVICSKWNEDKRDYLVYASYTHASLNTPTLAVLTMPIVSLVVAIAVTAWTFTK